MNNFCDSCLFRAVCQSSEKRYCACEDFYPLDDESEETMDSIIECGRLQFHEEWNEYLTDTNR